MTWFRRPRPTPEHRRADGWLTRGVAGPVTIALTPKTRFFTAEGTAYMVVAACNVEVIELGTVPPPDYAFRHLAHLLGDR